MSFFENTRKPVGLGGKIMVAMMNVGHSAVARWGLQFLELAPDARVLDCGCGGGANMKRLLKKCPQGVVKGIDYCIAIMSYYTVCKAVTSFREIEEMEENLILPIFRRLRFVDCNKPFWRKLMYRAFVRAKTGCDKWHDYEMTVAPYDKDDPIYYEFTSCPAAEFAIRHGLTDIMPALCNVDYASMELLHARLVRTTTCVDGCRCDYTICGDKDPYLKEHPEYRDEVGFRRNK